MICRLEHDFLSLGGLHSLCRGRCVMNYPYWRDHIFIPFALCSFSLRICDDSLFSASHIPMNMWTRSRYAFSRSSAAIIAMESTPSVVLSFSYSWGRNTTATQYPTTYGDAWWDIWSFCIYGLLCGLVAALWFLHAIARLYVGICFQEYIPKGAWCVVSLWCRKSPLEWVNKSLLMYYLYPMILF